MPSSGGLICYLTCLMYNILYIPYLVKLYKPKNHEFSLKLHISQCQEVKCETVINNEILLCFMALFYLVVMQFLP